MRGQFHVIYKNVNKSYLSQIHLCKSLNPLVFLACAANFLMVSLVINYSRSVLCGVANGSSPVSESRSSTVVLESQHNLPHAYTSYIAVMDQEEVQVPAIICGTSILYEKACN